MRWIDTHCHLDAPEFGGDAAAVIARARAAGADLVQIYTGFIYKGPELVTEAALALKQNTSR